jgi:RNA polymerase sigma factor (sigma-70 family)
VTELAAVPSRGRASTIESTAESADAAALAGLYERHSQQVFRFCLGYLRKRDEAEDAAQTTFLHALRALRRGVVPSSESAWLLKIARNVCLNRFDYARRRGRLELVQDPVVLAEISPARANGDMDLGELQAALRRLPPRQRRAILLREWQGLSYAEIGEELGLSTSAVETLLFRARRTLARELGGEVEKRHGLDLAGLFGWAKALLGGTAAKLAAGAAVVATIGVVAPISVHDSNEARGPARVPASQAPLAHAAAPAAAHTPSRLPASAAALARAAVVGARSTAAPRPVSPPSASAPTSAPPTVPVPRSEPSTPAAPAASDSAPTTTTSALTSTPVSLPSVPDPTQAVTTPLPVPTVPDIVPQLPPLPLPPPPDPPPLPPVDPPTLP